MPSATTAALQTILQVRMRSPFSLGASTRENSAEFSRVDAPKEKGDLMRTWRIVCSAAVVALGIAAAAHADEWNKLTYLTFSGPVTMPGITLPAGTYRFELMDPDASRRVIRVSDKDGSKNYGIFLSISDQKLQPSD